MNPSATPIAPGLMVLHGNRLEELRDVLAAWLQREPLAPLEDETVLVQSNGIAQWFKLALARDRIDGGLGISAAVDVQLPGRFLWTAYRAVLGRDAVPAESPFDESRLTWRLLRLLPAQLERDGFAPLREYLGDDNDARKRYQLARRLADLYDQYQVYRADWLDDWAAGNDVLADELRGTRRELPANQRWQAALWRCLLDDVGSEHRHGHRAAVHARFMHAALADGAHFPRLPRRIVVFGMSSLPQQTLEALAALGKHCQVLLVVMNPCRHYWADIVEDRELLRAAQRRQANKPGMPLLPDGNTMHLHANPLLAAWGKQGRDYIRMLDAFDEVEAYRARFSAWDQRVDLFSDPDKHTLLANVQRAILDLEPLPAAKADLAAGDDSIVFHVAHGPQREVEILHDQLLSRFARAAADGEPMLPRDVIVMVPDIQAYAPYIEAVFGRIDRDDPRYIPFSVADRQARGNVPLVVALEHVLKLPESRFTVSDLLDLLDVPALRLRFAIGDDDLATLRRWIEGAGIRWGLDGRQRASLGLPALDQNSWHFGLRRMLLGYAVGSGEALDGIEPYDEVAGLDAALIGPLADLLEALGDYWNALRQPARPAAWGVRLRALLKAFFDRGDAADATRLDRLDEVLEAWERACEEGGVDEPLPAAIVAEAWLEGFDKGELSQRFMAGAVSFGTLMPMRAIPFRLVCLLGMNDGAYPRARPPMDFDLMSIPGGWRPGDRSRREDDRYLFLEALLSARDALHIGWVGRNVRDNGERPPSVLVGQLRDYLSAGWRDGDADVLERLTVVHPLQPFSTGYFLDTAGRDPRLFTFAREWREALEPTQPDAVDAALAPWLPDAPLNLAGVSAFFRHPIRQFFQQRLRVYFDQDNAGHDDLEPFALDGLQRHALTSRLLAAGIDSDDIDAALSDEGERLRRSGQLPMAGLAAPVLRDLTRVARSVLARFRQQKSRWPVHAAKHEIQLNVDGMRIEDWLTDLHASADGSEVAQLSITPSSLLQKSGTPAAYKLGHAWAAHLLAHASGLTLTTRVIGSDATASFPPMAQEKARGLLRELLASWQAGMTAPLPIAIRTAFAFMVEESAELGERAAARCYDGDSDFNAGEVSNDPYLSRAYPDFASLRRAGFLDRLGPYRAMYRAFDMQADA